MSSFCSRVRDERTSYPPQPQEPQRAADSSSNATMNCNLTPTHVEIIWEIDTCYLPPIKIVFI